MQSVMRRTAFVALARSAWLAALFLASLGFAGTSSAQKLPQPFAAMDASATRDLDAADAALKAIEAVLHRHEVTDKDLQEQRDKTAPIVVALQTLLDHLKIRLAAVKVRLDQLGPAPSPKAAPESEQVTKERQLQQQEYEAVDALVKRAKLLLVQAQQVNTWIAARQHAKFTHSLFERNQSLVDPGLWLNAIAMTPHNFKTARAALGDWIGAINGKLAGWRAPAFWILVLAAVVFYWPFSVFALHRLVRESDQARPGRLRKIIAAWWVTFIIVGCPLLVFGAVAGLLRAFNLFDAANQAILLALLKAVAYVAAAAGLASGLLAPAHMNWRLVSLGAERCRQARDTMIAVAILLGVSHLVTAFCETIGVDAAYQAALSGIFAFCVALAIMAALWRAGTTECGSDDILGPRVTQSRDWYGILRILLWIAAVAIVIAAAAGFMRLAAFLADQIYWVGFVGIVAVMLFILAAEAIAAGCKPTAPFGRALMTSAGLRSGSIEQIAILLNGAATVVIFLAAVLIVLAPWGIQSSDLPTYLRAAFFGFRVGDITVSLASLGMAIAIFIAGVMATRAVERWLDVRFLPHTQLDIGLRNAIKTSFGYVGIVIALGFASAYLGFNFEKLAIVAGALSVGIGFGLQSIVNNFVSGLILLWSGQSASAIGSSSAATKASSAASMCGRRKSRPSTAPR